MPKKNETRDETQIKSKICDYLLNLEHAEGGPKANFFKQIGYTKKNWEELADQLVFDPKFATKRPATAFGQPFSLNLNIKSADGSRTYTIQTAWFQDTGETIIKLVTAYPS